jgi:hypothetical protein
LSAAPLPLPNRSQLTAPAGAATTATGGSSVSRLLVGSSRVFSGVGAGWGFSKGVEIPARSTSPGPDNTSSSDRGEAMLPETSAGSSSSRGSLSWVQQQLRRGLQLGGGGGPPASAVAAQGMDGSVVAAVAAPNRGAGGGSSAAPCLVATGATSDIPSVPGLKPPVAGGDAMSKAAGPSPSSASRSGTKRGSCTPVALAAEWPETLAQELLICGSNRLQREPVTGLAIAAGTTAGGAPLVCCVGYEGLLRMLQLPQLEAYRWVHASHCCPHCDQSRRRAGEADAT